jgi:TolB-like protein
LDLTDLVLDELNREFAPVPGEEEEREEIKIAVFPFSENTLAEEEKSADRVFQSLYSLIDQSAKYEAIPKDRIDNLLAAMGLERERTIPQDRAVEIAQSVDAKVLLIGEINKTIVQLEVTAKLVDAETGVLLLSETQKAEGETEEAFQTMMSDIASAVIQRYRP